MSKKALAIVFFALIFVFAGADYFLNVARSGNVVRVGDPDSAPNWTEMLLEKNLGTLDYQLTSRTRSLHLFEKVDLSGLTGIRIYQNRLEKSESLPILVYEMQGPPSQGGITYLNIKLKFLETIDATESLNESNEFGHSSFYFNDLNAPDTAYLVVQVQDNVFGFQFNKTKDFETVKGMIDTLMQTI